LLVFVAISLSCVLCVVVRGDAPSLGRRRAGPLLDS
jgi:hypothetical protein